MHGAQGVVARTPRGRRKPSLPVLESALSAVMSGGIPNVDRADTLGTVRITDPFEEQDWRDGKSGRPPVRIKVVSLRDDPLGRLLARSQVDEAQYSAGRQWQAYYHDAEIGTLKAIDFTREAVDGGRMPEVLTDRQRKAMAEITRLDRALGLDGSALVRQVLGHRMFMNQVAQSRGESGRHVLEYFGRRFRECLETLAKEMGLA